jgi:hypothetical protein
VNPSNTVTSEPQRPPSISSAATAKTAVRAAQSKTSTKARSRPGKASAKAAPANRPIKRRQTDGSKQDRVIALLRRREGATLAALVKATGSCGRSELCVCYDVPRAVSARTRGFNNSLRDKVCR